MYFFFTALGSKCDIYIYIFFFFVQFNNNSKKNIVQPMGSTRTNTTHVGWVGLMDRLGWVGLNFFLTNHGGLGQKIPFTRPNLTHAHLYQ